MFILVFVTFNFKMFDFKIKPQKQSEFHNKEKSPNQVFGDFFFLSFFLFFVSNTNHMKKPAYLQNIDSIFGDGDFSIASIQDGKHLFDQRFNGFRIAAFACNFT